MTNKQEQTNPKAGGKDKPVQPGQRADSDGQPLTADEIAEQQEQARKDREQREADERELAIKEGR